MAEIVLQAEPRTVIGKQVKALRREGGLPAILYGKNFDPIPVTLNMHDASKVLSTVTSSHLVVLEVDGNQHNVLVRERQHDPIRGQLLHVDFQVVSLTERLRAQVTIVLDGEAPAVREFNGVVVTGVEELEVESLPQNLPERVVVDISILREIGDAIYVKDIALPEDVEVLTDLEEMVALVTAQAVEEEEEVEEVEEEEEEPEIIERGKREEGEEKEES